MSAWLDRFIANHGPAPWASLEAALGAHPLHPVAQQVMATMAVDDVVVFDDLGRVMNRLWIDHLEAQAGVLATRGSTDPQAMSELRVVLGRIKALKEALSAPLARSNRPAIALTKPGWKTIMWGLLRAQE